MPAQKEDQKEKKPEVTGSNTLAVLAMVFGVVSLSGFGLLFGIPAIVLASIALKKGLPEKGLSIVGLVTGIISTVMSILFLIVMVFVFIWAADHPGEFDQPAMPRGHATERQFESSRT